MPAALVTKASDMIFVLECTREKKVVSWTFVSKRYELSVLELRQSVVVLAIRATGEIVDILDISVSDFTGEESSNHSRSRRTSVGLQL